VTSTDVPESTRREWWRVDKSVLLSRTVKIEIAVRKLLAEQYEVYAEIHRRDLRGVAGHDSLAGLIEEDLRLTPADAKARAGRVLALHPTPTFTGQDVPAVAPLTAVAAAEGAVGGAQIDPIIHALAQIPATVPEEKVRDGEKILVDLARIAGPKEVARAARNLLARLDPDGKEPKDDEPTPIRPELKFVHHRDGSLGVVATVDQEIYARLKTDLDPLAKPHKKTEDGEKDPRTQAERYGDAFGDYVRMKTASPDLPSQAGESTHILITMSYEDLMRDLSEAQLELVGPLNATDARMLACDCRIRPVVLGKSGEPLDVGRSARTVTIPQKYALTARDRGCAWPGCDMPVFRCTAHHIAFWRHHGETKIDNLVLLCGRHHKLIHSSQWTVRIAQDGLPEFTPPAYLDPTGTPRRNTMHLRI
jgi:hypothetical protein